MIILSDLTIRVGNNDPCPGLLYSLSYFLRSTFRTHIATFNRISAIFWDTRFPAKGGKVSWKECFKGMHPDGEMDHQMHPDSCDAMKK